VVNLYDRAVGTAEQVPKTKRHDHLPGAKGYFNVATLLAAGVPRVVAIFGAQGWRWDWVREVRELVFALDADSAGQQQWRQFARQAPLRGKRVAGLPAAAYGGHKDVSAAWVAGVLRIGDRPAAVGAEKGAVPEDLREAWEERVAIRIADGQLPCAEAERLAWAGLQVLREAP
jgi:hypothetical protein